ncbi:uncharacterized protein HD556DRAFT_1448167 [Suillus plorans]|uniref:Uncharacterized protein n=1 Tax=Suillus plorans TaxID=116603 RepID=A0A9P7DCP1_9AGAM|nr:uncharacterized protein HD556DRAFT_1448167 [Suillus plorans]KAG1787996.1 hypothetical protein HD556DRAFT_1448167 [Suillus plorans]
MQAATQSGVAFLMDEYKGALISSTTGSKWAVWGLEDWVKAGFMAIWVPELWAMYAHMARMRRKVLSVGKSHSSLGARFKDRFEAE